MPSKEEQLQTQVQELRNQVAALQAELTQLHTLVTQHTGLDYGAVQLNAPHPKQQVSTLTFGGGDMRLDTHGIQLASHGSNTGDIGIAFVDEFVDNPNEVYPRAIFYGSTFVNNDAAQIQSLAMGIYAVASILHTVSGQNADLILAAGSSNGTARMYFHAEQTKQGIYITGAPFRVDSVTADYSSTGDGYLWYRSDTDKFRAVANGVTENLATESWVRGDKSEKTIAAGVITVTGHFHLVDTEADAATDDLDTINGGTTGQVIVLKAADGARDVVLKDGTGNLNLNGDFTLDNAADTISLIYNGASWDELSRSDNGA